MDSPVTDRKNPYRILVIGGGGTGAAILHDLTIRGFDTLLLEKGELTSGTTGRHHGQLHSGARYALKDPQAARECIRENRILRKIAPGALEMNEGLFVALTGQEEAFARVFLESCRTCGIPTRVLDAGQALALEPNLSPSVRMAVQVPDGTIDAWRLPLLFFSTAKHNGAEIRTFTEVMGMERQGGRITGLWVLDHKKNREYEVKGDLVINAAGPWAGKISGMAGVKIQVQPTPGVMVAIKGRLTNMVVNRLAPAGDADILVPQRNLSVMGTTSWTAEDPDDLPCPEDHIRMLLQKGSQMVPALEHATLRAAWAAARPLLHSEKGQDGRELSRAFQCFDHGERDGLEGMVSVAGGKATTLRAMAEKTVDLVCRKLGLDLPCRTHDIRLRPYRDFFA